jgi:hypothetical protein
MAKRSERLMWALKAMKEEDGYWHPLDKRKSGMPELTGRARIAQNNALGLSEFVRKCFDPVEDWLRKFFVAFVSCLISSGRPLPYFFFVRRALKYERGREL